MGLVGAGMAQTHAQDKIDAGYALDSTMPDKGPAREAMSKQLIDNHVKETGPITNQWDVKKHPATGGLYQPSYGTTPHHIIANPNSPPIVAHELGHADFHTKHPTLGGLAGKSRRFAPLTPGIGLAAGTALPGENHPGYVAAASLAAHSPILLDEGYANYKALSKLKGVGYNVGNASKQHLLPSLGHYLALAGKNVAKDVLGYEAGRALRAKTTHDAPQNYYQ
jgi:hypothetical protein